MSPQNRNAHLFSSLPTGTRFVYYGDHERVYIKDDTYTARLQGTNQWIKPGHVLVFTFEYCAHDNERAHIGYLRAGHFVCHSCNDTHDTEPDASVYLVNVTPYQQHCHDCGRLIVLGKTPAWCELFE